MEINILLSICVCVVHVCINTCINHLENIIQQNTPMHTINIYKVLRNLLNKKCKRCFKKKQRHFIEDVKSRYSLFKDRRIHNCKYVNGESDF